MHYSPSEVQELPLQGKLHRARFLTGRRIDKQSKGIHVKEDNTRDMDFDRFLFNADSHVNNPFSQDERDGNGGLHNFIYTSFTCLDA